MSVTDPAFLTMTYCQVTYVFLCLLSFYRTTLKKKKKKKKKKLIEKLHRPGIEPGTSRSPVLHFTTAMMHTLRNYYRKSLLKQWGLPKL